MTAALEQMVIPFLEHLYASMGYVGVLLAMAIESACIPLPSEIVLPMAGWMVSRGIWDFWVVVVFATVGNTLGSVIAYSVGAFGGRPLLERYGRYVLISAHDMEIADRWFARYGEWAVFFSRMLPIVRTFISLPAGIVRMNFAKFIVYSTLGALPWSLLLVYAGKIAGDNWVAIRQFLHQFDYVILALLIAAIAFYVYRHLRRSASRREEAG
ncbi:MAG: DedA family protein [Dehalococcoidales bacterium]|nr:DedA family protein [Dehalococcoidales bacterium]